MRTDTLQMKNLNNLINVIYGNVAAMLGFTATVEIETQQNCVQDLVDLPKVQHSGFLHHASKCVFAVSGPIQT